MELQISRRIMEEEKEQNLHQKKKLVKNNKLILRRMIIKQREKNKLRSNRGQKDKEEDQGVQPALNINLNALTVDWESKAEMTKTMKWKSKSRADQKW